MSLDTNDEILQDFLVEAGEILEQLNEQLVDLEQRPDDYDLLNAVFRGFHTIKGGAGFLNITPLVEVTHKAEDVFNLLRQGKLQVTPELMDPVLEVLDVVNGMFALINQGEMPSPADAGLIQALVRLANPGAATPSKPEPKVAPKAAAKAKAKPEPKPESKPKPKAPIETSTGTPAASDEITESEFDALLDQLQEEKRPASPASPEAAADDEITEDEFEHLLDELHGKGKFKAVGAEGGVSEAQAAAASDDITEEEFEHLLDEMHGKGRFVPEVAAAFGVQDAKPQSQAVPLPPAMPPRTTRAHAESEDNADAEAGGPALPRVSSNGTERAAASKTAPTAPVAETTVRVDTSRLDEIMNLVGELVLVRNRLQNLKSSMADEAVSQVVSNLDVVTADLQLSVMKTRMQPIKKVFGRFPRVVRDLARSLKKEIDLVLVGEDTDLDKNLVEALADPLVHLVRNAVDHGVESPDDREQAGKPRKGTVILSAAQAGDHIILSIQDDGKGMNADFLRRKAVEKGMMDEEAAARLDAKECFNLIFAPGFSTKEVASDVSGRGVGMDVVKTRISQMNGQVEVDSVEGKGSTILIKLPLTLAILPTLMVILGEQPFALPLSSVVEIFNLDLSKRNVVDGRQTIMVRNRALPLFFLSDWLIKGHVTEKMARGHVVVVNMGGTHIGLVVDHLVGQEEVVIKPLGFMLQGLGGMAGATITGDGKIALILDIPGLMRKYAHRA